MIPSIRTAFNTAFTEAQYEAFRISCQERFNKQIEFKICETPVFISKEFGDKLKQAGDDIIRMLMDPSFNKEADKAIPPHCFVPGEEGKPVFIALDFGICTDTEGNLIPQLIEMQGFASLYAWQHALGTGYKKYFPIPDTVDHLFNGLDEKAYVQLLRNAIIGTHDPASVVILEIEPHKQKTWIDFYLTREMLGIQPVCISEIIKEGNTLYYMLDGNKTRINRIYNRLIFDELAGRPDLQRQWNLVEPADVEWVCHPNWFFRISKYTLPFLKHPAVPETIFLTELNNIPAHLEEWVLKPLFSFAGHGVIFNVTEADLRKAMETPEHFILQKKVTYKPVIATLDEPAKAEIRLMYIWEPEKDHPTLVINLARLSKGVMIGVDYNKNKTWVGGTVGYFEK